jgi:hypothetical protein
MVSRRTRPFPGRFSGMYGSRQLAGGEAISGEAFERDERFFQSARKDASLLGEKLEALTTRDGPFTFSNEGRC